MRCIPFVTLWPGAQPLAAGLRLFCLAAALLGAGSGRASERADCQAPRYRAFDFWLGEWTVQLADGRHAGRNRITASANGCYLEEHWTSAGGGTGYSLNYFDPGTDHWRQLWVSRDGLIDISGNLEGDSMVLSGEITDRLSGERVPFRGRWTPLSDGRVRQFFEQHNADTWEPWFEGFYTKVVE